MTPVVKEFIDALSAKLQEEELQFEVDGQDIVVYDYKVSYPVKILEGLENFKFNYLGMTVNPLLCIHDDEYYGVYFGMIDPRYMVTFTVTSNDDEGHTTLIELTYLGEDTEKNINIALELFSNNVNDFVRSQLSDLFDQTAIVNCKPDDVKSFYEKAKVEAVEFFDELIKKNS